MTENRTLTPRSDASKRSDDGDAARLFCCGGVTVCSLERRRVSIATMCDGDGVKDGEDGTKWRSVERWKERGEGGGLRRGRGQACDDRGVTRCGERQHRDRCGRHSGDQ